MTTSKRKKLKKVWVGYINSYCTSPIVSWEGNSYEGFYLDTPMIVKNKTGFFTKKVRITVEEV